MGASALSKLKLGMVIFVVQASRLTKCSRDGRTTIVAINPDRSLLEKDFPYIRTMEGMDLNRWLKSTEKYVAKEFR